MAETETSHFDQAAQLLDLAKNQEMTEQQRLEHLMAAQTHAQLALVEVQRVAASIADRLVRTMHDAVVAQSEPKPEPQP